MKRLLVVAVMAGAILGTSAPLAGADYEVCPFAKVKGKRYEVCLRMPL